MNTAWTEQRLRRLYARYNRRFWNGRLPGFAVVISNLGDKGPFGFCDSTARKVTIHVTAHRNAQEIRATLLHEMAHVAADLRGSRGHDIPFFGELERLLRRGAPISISSPEAGLADASLSDLVPRRFRLLRQRMERAGARKGKQIERHAAENNLTIRDISDEEMLRTFGDAAVEGTWKEVVRVLGIEYGLIDEAGRPLTPFARGLLARARKVHARARRDYLKYERLRKSLGLCGAIS